MTHQKQSVISKGLFIVLLVVLNISNGLMFRFGYRDGFLEGERAGVRASISYYHKYGDFETNEDPKTSD